MTTTTTLEVAVVRQIEKKLGISLFDHQMSAIVSVLQQQGWARSCLYFKTGSGKSITALAQLYCLGFNTALVITPPSTYDQWREVAGKLGMHITCVSHAKFRQLGFKVQRDTPVIADEFHMFGGHTGQGWKKLDRMAAGLRAPMILASATPNYNDAERVYCIQHILDPDSTRGGYIEFLYKHCNTKHNPYGMTPLVEGFRNYSSAADYLAVLPGVSYLPDDVHYSITNHAMPAYTNHELTLYGWDVHRNRIVASQMEERHLRANYNVISPRTSQPYSHIKSWLQDWYATGKTLLVYCTHETIASALTTWLVTAGIDASLISGKTPEKAKAEIIRQFNNGNIPVLVGTASLATGTDGMDKVCDTLLIVDDTDDDAFRRQLIGRIMPRGTGSNVSSKTVERLVFS